VARSFSQVGVVGLGTMGAGIAEVLARAGLTVVGVERDAAGLDRAEQHLATSTERAVRRGKLTAAEAAELRGRISTGTDLAALAGCELVLEAIPERMELKAELFARLDDLLAPDAVLATNTSALSVTELATGTRRPGRVVGLHWFNPAPVMGLVEVVRTVVTDPAVLEDVQALVAQVGKTAATAVDRAGFIANALLFGYLNNALRMYESRYATREDIDAAMRWGTGHPMGPLALLDLIGLDSAYEILETMYRQSRDHRHAPAPLLKQYVAAGTARAQGRPRHLHLRGARLGRTWSPTRRRRAARALRRARSGASASWAPARWPAASWRSARRSGYDVVFRARTDDKVAAVRKRVEGSLAKALERGRSKRADRDAGARPDHRHDGASTTWPTATGDRGVVEDLAVKKALFAELDRVLAGRCWRRPPRVARWSSARGPTGRPADVGGDALGSTRHGHAVVEVVPTVITAEDVVAPCSRSAPVPASTPSGAVTGPRLHRQRAACSRTSTTP
jgi:3-hydroxybutyryl-CoA dehydrogenase